MDPDPEPDQLVRGTDPRIRIRTKMSRIHNTAEVYEKCKNRKVDSSVVEP